MVNLREITDFLHSVAPEYLAESYDNVGLLIEAERENIERVLISLDTDADIAAEAKEKNCELLISHHPLIFKPLKNVRKNDAVFSLIKNNISLYAMHTNYDAADGGLCDVLLNRIMTPTKVYALSGEADEAIGRIAELKEETSFRDFVENVKAKLGKDSFRIVGDIDKRIKTVALCGGGGADYVYDALSKGADLYISGDFKYHHARKAYEEGMALMEITHYDAEILFIDEIAKKLEEEFGGRLEIIKSEKNTDPWHEA